MKTSRPNPKPEPKPDSEKRSPLENYARYSNIAFQMLAVIVLGIFGGVKLDQWIAWRFPIFTVLLSVLSVFTAIYLVIKDFFRK